jgi:crotonobetainyl-CoA:carnitine CoA-transferase CaiB-like acyl-CoA transferase
MAILDGVKVVDFGTALSAPYAAMLLADLGADVIKVEKPKRGDLMRFTDNYVGGQSGYFLGINRGKRGITLDLRTPRGREIALELCRDADILIENFTAGVMDSWGLSYEAVREVAPDIIYCSVSAFGSVPGFETRSGNDITAQAYSGLMALTGEEDGPPVKAGSPVTDVATGCFAAIATLAALIQRDRTGRGAHVKTSLIDTAFALMSNFTTSVLNGTPRFRRVGSGHPQLAPYRAYPTADGKYLVVGIFHQESWDRLCNALERPDLIGDERFSTNSRRVHNRHKLDEVIGCELAQRDLAHWTEAFDSVDIPFSPILEIEESLELFTQAQASLLAEGIPSAAGPLTMLRAPFEIDGERPCHPVGAPSLGADTDAVLGRLGLTLTEIGALRQQGIV